MQILLDFVLFFASLWALIGLGVFFFDQFVTIDHETRGGKNYMVFEIHIKPKMLRPNG